MRRPSLAIAALAALAALGSVSCDSPPPAFADYPEMVVVSAGSFMMGSPESEEGRDDDEGPLHRVTIGYSFAVGKYEGSHPGLSSKHERWALHQASS